MRASDGGQRMPGEPLMVLSLVLGGWIVLRVLFWQSPFDHAAARLAPPPVLPAPMLERRRASSGEVWPIMAAAPVAVMRAAWAPTACPRLPTSVREERTVAPAPAAAQWSLPPAAIVVGPAAAESAALGRPDSVGRRPATFARWSSDAWLLLRHGSGGPAAAIRPSYGRSQTGVVLRYRLAAASAYRPVAYGRIARALSGPTETELAAGIAGRPLVGVPVSVGAEVRLTDRNGGREVRPGAYAVTELPPVPLPFGLRGEGYAQAGYVGGRFATAFADGQARIDAAVARVDRVGELRAGAGAWGGAQKGAARLDLGPSVVLGVVLGRTQARLTLDYRFRVAGDAAPADGPALTISAGF